MMCQNRVGTDSSNHLDTNFKNDRYLTIIEAGFGSQEANSKFHIIDLRIFVAYFSIQTFSENIYHPIQFIPVQGILSIDNFVESFS